MKTKTTFIITGIVLILLLIWNSCREKEQKLELAKEDQLTTHLSTLIDSCWNSQNIKAFGDLATTDFTRNLNGISVAKNINEMEAHIEVFLTAFPDLEISVEESEIKGDKIFFLWQATGTNTGIFGEMGATGKKVKINGLSHLYFSDSAKLYREDVYYNELDLLQQLGYTLTPPNLE
ncbi:MAG: ester cyclase [Flavobacteriaceae bacterium]